MKRGAAPKYKELGSSPAKVDLTKKTGRGPMAGGITNPELVQDTDDQSREAAKEQRFKDLQKYSDLEKYDDDRG